MSLVDTIPDSVLPNLPYDRSDPAVGSALANKHPAEILCLYLNWRNRLIPTQPRSVAKSIVFNQNPIAAHRSEAISEIVADIEQGNDLTKYLSRRVTTGFAFPPKPGAKNLAKFQHLDLLLNEWGIHHLHVSPSLEAICTTGKYNRLLLKTSSVCRSIHRSRRDDGHRNLHCRAGSADVS
jgi:hypothetical protein